MNDEDVVDNAALALEHCQTEAQRGLEALERVHFHLDASASAEVYEALEDVYRALTAITWL